MANEPTRILVVDDSALYRQSIRNALRGIEHAECCGIAKDGVDAIEKIKQLDPDLLTLDVQMPGMDGIEVLREIKRRKLRPKALMVSSLTSEGASVTTEALMEGAFDFILKPSGSASIQNRDLLRSTLREKLEAFRAADEPSNPIRERGHDVGVTETIPAPASSCRMVVIGTSTGGPAALKTILARLPQQLPVPVLIVQHMPPTYTSSLASRLNSICPLEVAEASDGMTVQPGNAILAAGGKQMEVRQDGDRVRVRVSVGQQNCRFRPSVDFLLRSVVELYGGDALALILTGMGSDGLEGCRLLKRAGGYVFAQSQDDCTVFGMPKAVICEGLADRTLTLGKMAPAIVRHLKRSRR